MCLGTGDHEEKRSPDHKWVKLGKDAKVWEGLRSSEPHFLHVSQNAMYMLISSPDLGDLIRLIPTQHHGAGRLRAGSGEADDELAADLATGSSSLATQDLPKLVSKEDLLKADHWIVQEDGLRIAVSKEAESEDDFALREGDLLKVGSHELSRIFRDGSVRWLVIPLGAQVYRGQMMMLGATGYTARSGYVKIEDGEKTYLRKHFAVETGMSISLLSGYGEPWVVEHDQVIVRRGPSVQDLPMGIMLKGDVAGVQRIKGDWVQLVQDADVRFKKKEGLDQSSLQEVLCPINSLRRRKVPLPGAVLAEAERPLEQVEEEEPSAASTAKAFMLVEHRTLGQLLRRARKRKGGLDKGCVLGEPRGGMYREVIELCHRRIYRENLDGLWDGDVDKLPTEETLEGKLFDVNVTVIHVTLEGVFAGGAIVKKFRVRAKQLEGSTNLNLSGTSPGNSQEIPGHTSVGYIDSCAAEPGTRIGRAIWDTIIGMKVMCVACHSILLQKTVDFWQARGMLHLDPSSDKDCDTFRRLVMVHTMGKVVCELTDLQETLPKSKLPLFVWVPAKFAEGFIDQTSHVFRASEPKEPDETP